MTPVEVVLLDIGGVLVSEEPLTWGARWGLGTGELESLLVRIDPDDGLGLGHRDEQWLRDTLALELGLREGDADVLMSDLWDWYCGRPDHAMLDWVSSLRGRVRVAGLSNSADGARREEERRYAMSSLLDPILYSHELGMRKPDPAVYLHACQVMQVGAQQVVFVDDRAENVAAAWALGMTAVLHVDARTTIEAVESALRPPKVRA